MKVSVVIPVYNEGKKVLQDIVEAERFFSERRIDLELIVVDDGSRDDTRQVLEKAGRAQFPDLQILSYPENKGKGHAVRKGILHASADVVLFIDSGYCIPYEEVDRGIRIVHSGEADIAHASRFLPESRITRKKGPVRRLLSALFRRFIVLYMQLPPHLTDTQCGLKVYKKTVATALFSKSKTNGFMFDIEVIRLAQRLDCRIREFPVTWTADPDSRLRILPTFFRMFRELRRIKREVWED